MPLKPTTPPLQSLTRPLLPLSSLKTAQLQRIAQETGIRMSGPKRELLGRLERGLLNNGSTNTNTNAKKKMSILSIDMGIKNLAFAHLVVGEDKNKERLRSEKSLVSASGEGEDKMGGMQKEEKEGSNGSSRTQLQPQPQTHRVELHDWKRIAIDEDGVQAFCRLHNHHHHYHNHHNQHLLHKQDQEQQLSPSTSTSTSTTTSPTASANASTPFSLPLYASHAYTLLSALLAAYQPTHILIERQRFRSAGGSAVQEWTLRVGVFEGMLYAAAHAIMCERGLMGKVGSGAVIGNGNGSGSSAGGVSAPAVLGVDPGRVGRYWESYLQSRSGSQDEDGEERVEKETKKKRSAKEGKKMKIGLAGEWLSGNAIDGHGSGTGEVKLGLGPSTELRSLVDSYLGQWQKGKNRTRGGSAEMMKLDDLADCLVQGVTWWRWQVMKERMRESLQ